MKPEEQKQIALIEHCAKRIHEKTEQACKYCYDKFGVENSPDGLLEDIAEMALSIQVQARNVCANGDAQPAVAVNEQDIWDSALELAALTIQLFDEATLTKDDYMLDASECARIILALKAMRSVKAEAAKGGV